MSNPKAQFPDIVPVFHRDLVIGDEDGEIYYVPFNPAHLVDQNNMTLRHHEMSEEEVLSDEYHEVREALEAGSAVSKIERRDGKIVYLLNLGALQLSKYSWKVRAVDVNGDPTDALPPVPGHWRWRFSQADED